MSCAPIRACCRDHLRVCGADSQPNRVLILVQGSSPRVRSRHVRVLDQRPRIGIISACAEQTSNSPIRSCGVGDHLRVCGADPLVLVERERGRGSSPRVRSRQKQLVAQEENTGIISACAEQTRA